MIPFTIEVEGQIRRHVLQHPNGRLMLLVSDFPQMRKKFPQFIFSLQRHQNAETAKDETVLYAGPVEHTANGTRPGNWVNVNDVTLTALSMYCQGLLDAFEFDDKSNFVPVQILRETLRSSKL